MSMMKNETSIFVFLFFTLSFAVPGGAAEKGEEPISPSLNPDIVFSITGVTVEKKANSSPLDMSDEMKTPLQKTQIPVTIIMVDLVNNSKIKKLNLADRWMYQLSDEFGNVYRQLQVPSDYVRPVVNPNEHYPSFYPGEKYEETVFFEPPVENSQQLSLTIDASKMGIPEPLLLTIPKERYTAAPPQPSLGIPSDKDIQVVSPVEGMQFKPGETVKIQLQCAEGIPVPDKIYVISQRDVFEDETQSYLYDLKLPLDQPFGPYTVLVVAKWQKEPKVLISKSITFDIIDLKEECVENCTTAFAQ